MQTPSDAVVVDFLQHERNANVTAYSQGFYFKNKRGNLQRGLGIRTILKKHLWPDYKYEENLALGRQSSAGKKRPRQRSRHSPVGKPWSSRSKYLTDPDSGVCGEKRGTLVHDQLSYYARFYHVDRQAFDRKWPKPNIYTTKVIVALHVLGLTPYYGEMPIYDDFIGYTTAIDLVCADKQGQLVLVELKTGYNDCFLLGTKPLAGPMGQLFSNAPVNQAFFQALCMQETVRQCYGIKNARAVVLRVCDSSVDLLDLPELMTKMSSDIYCWIAEKQRNKPKYAKKIPKLAI